MPGWLQFYLDSTDRYYGPSREVSTAIQVITDCEAFEEKVKTLGEKFHDEVPTV